MDDTTSARAALCWLRDNGQAESHVLEAWRERVTADIEAVNGLPLSDPERGPALANLLDCEDLLAEIMRLAEGAARDA